MKEPVYGNLDKKREHKFPKAGQNKFVVRFSRMLEASRGHVIEDPGSIRYDMFSQEFWEEHVTLPTEYGEADNLTRVNGMKKEILHDPTRVAELGGVIPADEPAEEKKKPGRPKKTEE